MQPVTSVTILYDAACGLCTFAKEWIEKQSPVVGVEFIAAGSVEAQRAFPQIPPSELAVVADTGEVWLGKHAWIVCLWALRDYRDMAFRLAGPALLRLSREAFLAVSRNRLALSNMLRLRSEREIEQHLRRVAAPRCQAGSISAPAANPKSPDLPCPAPTSKTPADRPTRRDRTVL
jgi:predicted DCC family thiol-disulfide oxidoreductase YuxK